MINQEIKKVVARVKEGQEMLKELVKTQAWVADAKKYAEKQREDVKRIFATDLSRVRAFLDKERQELEKIHRQIPGEVKKLRSFVNEQKKELRSLVADLKKGAAPVKRAPASRKPRSKKTAAASKAK